MSVPQLPQDGRPIWERIAELAEQLPDEVVERMPTDGASELDHYLYGAKRRNPMADRWAGPEGWEDLLSGLVLMVGEDEWFRRIRLVLERHDEQIAQMASALMLVLLYWRCEAQDRPWMVERWVRLSQEAGLFDDSAYERWRMMVEAARRKEPNGDE